jgi:hypothetical protein
LPRIYHFTDVGNLPGIIATRELRCHRAAPTAVEVGSASIKASRSEIEVPCGPGGMVCDYVPFYYAPRSPMLYTIMRGNVPGVSSDQRRLIYLATTTDATYEAGLACVFTDGNAATSYTQFGSDPTALATLVDWQVMRLQYWANTAEDGDRRRRRMAEFLVHRAVPLELIGEVGVFNDEMRARVAGLASAAGWDITIRIRRGWYF